MRARAVITALLVTASCVELRRVSVTFGDFGEGLDGFLCKDKSGRMLLERLQQDAGTVPASLVVDFVRLGGAPSCRTGKLMQWCSTHECAPIRETRSCVTVDLPADNGADRPTLRKLIHERLRTLAGRGIIPDAPDEFVIVRVVGTAQSCDEVMPAPGGPLPRFERQKLVGCAYSCPVLLDKVEDELYLGFETLTAECEQGVAICADDQLHWQP